MSYRAPQSVVMTVILIFCFKTVEFVCKPMAICYEIKMCVPVVANCYVLVTLVGVLAPKP